MMFFWLVVAFGVDGIDGPLARATDVKVNAPRIDGVLVGPDHRLSDLCVHSGLCALFTSGLLPGWTGWFAIIVITFTSALYFCRHTHENSGLLLRGLPGLLEHGGFGAVRRATELLGKSWDRYTFWQLRCLCRLNSSIPSAPSAGGCHLADGLGWTFFAGWAAWVDFRSLTVGRFGG